MISRAMYGIKQWTVLNIDKLYENEPIDQDTLFSMLSKLQSPWAQPCEGSGTIFIYFTVTWRAS